MTRWLCTALTLVAALATAGPCAQEQPEIDFKSSEVAFGIFMVEGTGGFGGGNMAVLVGGQYVVMIDDSLEPRASSLKTLAPKLPALIRTRPEGRSTS